MLTEVKVRPYEAKDASATLKLFRRTIREVNSADYNPKQIAAWASDEIDHEQWHGRFNGRFAYVAELGEQIVGFVDMTADGYLDRLFVSAGHQRRGIAKALLRQIKADAKTAKLDQIAADVSITAQAFFLASGFQLVRDQTVTCRGVEFVNYHVAFLIDTP